MPRLFALLLIATVASLCGCGQKGPLVLPTRPAAPASATSAPAVPAGAASAGASTPAAPPPAASSGR